MDMELEAIQCADVSFETISCKQCGGDSGGMSKSWKKGRLGDVCRVIPGYAFKSSDWQAEGIPVVKIKNITTDNSVDLTETDCVPDSVLTSKLQKFILKDGDILLAMTGATAGKVGKVRTVRPILLNQRIAKIAPVEADYRFIWSIVSSQEYQEKFFKLADGAAQPNMSGGQIEGLEIPLPPLPVQKRIAGILSAYDELIENNQRRIKILETMARSLYREWFVHFRFPGHESVPLVASSLGEIPQGWEVKKLGDLAILNYGKALKKENRCDGVYPVYGSSGIVGMHDTSLVKGPGIIVGRKGNVGSVFWCDNDFFVIDTAYFVTSSLPLRFLFYVFPTLNFINSDAAVPGLSRNQAYTLEILVPPAALLKKFCELADAIFEQVNTLKRQIQNLRQTRDLLLPRLLSGVVNIEEQ
jgi:type I restriction enzyme S subunit